MDLRTPILSPSVRRRHLLARSACLLATVLLSLPAAWASPPITAETGQLLVVLSEDWDSDHGRLHRFERDGQGSWQDVGSFQVSLGRTGSAWGTGLHPLADLPQGPTKREGDGRSPAGMFAIGPAFGYARNHDFLMPYLPMDRQHWCMDVPASPLYNTVVDSREVGQEAVAGSTEPMRLDLHKQGDIRYRLGFVIEHNPDNVPGAGSCIFAHLRRAAEDVTAGCTAMDSADMDALTAWIDPARSPRLVLLPRAIYTQLQASWALPKVAEATAVAAVPAGKRRKAIAGS